MNRDPLYESGSDNLYSFSDIKAFQRSNYSTRNRFYDPKIGWYTTADSSTIDRVTNLYLYVQGDPVNFTDLLGLYDYVAHYHVNVTAFFGGIADVSGVIVAKDRNKYCFFDAINFSGRLWGWSISPIIFSISGTFNNVEEMTDFLSEYSAVKSNVTRVAGDSVVSGGSFAFWKVGKSGGVVKFGQLYGKTSNASDTEGWDLSIGVFKGKVEAVGNVYSVEDPYLK